MIERRRKSLEDSEIEKILAGITKSKNYMIQDCTIHEQKAKDFYRRTQPLYIRWWQVVFGGIILLNIGLTIALVLYVESLWREFGVVGFDWNVYYLLLIPLHMLTAMAYILGFTRLWWRVFPQLYFMFIDDGRGGAILQLWRQRRQMKQQEKEELPPAPTMKKPSLWDKYHTYLEQRRQKKIAKQKAKIEAELKKLEDERKKTFEGFG